jgi:pilus assembly protein FimV
VAQQTGRQYDDDLTVGAGEYNESFSEGYVDLFEPLSDEDSPIAKLKTIVLSIDWEITDDILHQLHDELQDLKDVWAGNKINLVYIQALEKVGQYISAEKARSHPNAIKLLLTFYSNLERIVSSASMSEEEKKQLLLQDIKRFEQFKIQIAPASKVKNKVAESPVAARAQVVAPAVAISLSSSQEQKNVLTNLKAIVLSIDWEISDNELVRLSEEVSKLEKVFSENRAKLIFLQGIGALGNYIRSTKSNAHPDAFKLLHSFYKGLERTYNEVLSGDKEKEILLAEVKKFNAFKSVIATVASEVVVPVDDSVSLAGKEEEEEEGSFVGPAFADMPEGVRGFREDAEAVKSDVDKSVASFLGEEEAVADQSVAAEGPEVSSRLDALFGNIEEPELTGDEVSADLALSGVEVETEADDDSDEQALPFHGGALAPALAETSGQSLYAEEVFSEKSPLASSFADIPVVPGLEVETEADDDSEEQALPFQGGALAPALVETSGQSLYAEEVSSEELPFTSSFAETPVVPGVDVETEADDESDEASLPREQGIVAPALAFSDETSGFRETEFVAGPDEEELDLEDRLDSFFGAEIEEASQGSAFHVPDDVHEEVSAVEVSPEVDREIKPGGLAEEQKISIAELSPAIEEVEPTHADVIFEGESAGFSAEARSEKLAVVFEPVGDDVAVDELPVELGGVGAIDDERTLEQESLARLQECVASILSKKYEAAFPAFFIEIDRLRQGWQAQYAKNTFLQLLLTVGKYIDTYRTAADAEAVTLLQSLCDKLEQVCQGKMGRDVGREQILFEETGTVLRWQQRLIAALMARYEGEDASFEVVDDLTDIFSEK